MAYPSKGSNEHTAASDAQLLFNVLSSTDGEALAGSLEQGTGRVHIGGRVVRLLAAAQDHMAIVVAARIPWPGLGRGWNRVPPPQPSGHPAHAAFLPAAPT